MLDTRFSCQETGVVKVTLTVAHGPHAGQSYTFQEHDNFIVGRASYAHFRLPKKDRYFSRVHFMIEVNPPYCRLMDMGSRNGTYVNEQRVKTIDIHDGDRIKGGHTLIQVSIEGAEPAPPRREPTPASSKQSPQLRAPAGQRPEVGSDDRRPTEKFAEEHSDARPDAGGDPGAIQADVSPDKVPAVGTGLSESGSIPTSTAGGHVPDDSNKADAAPADRFETVALEQVPTDVEIPAATRALLPDDFVDRINNYPQTVSGYLIVDELGRGGMGIVFRAIDRRDHSVVALKTIRPAVAVGEGDIDRFLREASILKELEHPHIVAFREMGEADGGLFFAMEYVPGTDAARLLKDNKGPLDIARAVGIACQLLAALQYAHAEGFVHRDIKPQNMLLGQFEGRGIVKLADFGLARTYQSSRISGLTMMGDVRGTSQYMSPEQITNYRETKPATDQYSAAATLYHLLTDRYIYDFPDTINRKFQMILQEDPVPIQDRRPDIPDRLAEIIHRALRRDPDQRFADVGELRAALVGFLGSGK